MLEIGKVVNTHGLKGEVRILSDFKYKDVIFKKGNEVYICGIKYIITSCRKHKIYDLICFEGLNDINDILNLKGENISINREDYVFEGILNEDLYGKKVYDKNKYIGSLKEIIKNKNQEILVIKGKKEILVPYVDEFVDNINEDIHLNLIGGFYED